MWFIKIKTELLEHHKKVLFKNKMFVFLSSCVLPDALGNLLYCLFSKSLIGSSILTTYSEKMQLVIFGVVTRGDFIFDLSVVKVISVFPAQLFWTVKHFGTLPLNTTTLNFKLWMSEYVIRVQTYTLNLKGFTWSLH